MKRPWFALCCPFFQLVLIQAAIADKMSAGNIAGRWVPPSGDAVVEIETGEIASLRLVRVLEPGTDENNPNVHLRGRALEGLLLGEGFERAGPWWKGGTLYDPANGRTYNGQIRRRSETELEVRGYLGAPVFGRSETWTRLDVYSERVTRLLEEDELSCALEREPRQ